MYGLWVEGGRVATCILISLMHYLIFIFNGFANIFLHFEMESTIVQEEERNMIQENGLKAFGEANSKSVHVQLKTV